MKKYARIENNTVVEIIECDDVADRYHPDFVNKLSEIGEKNVEVGMLKYPDGLYAFPVFLKTDREAADEQYESINNYINETLGVYGYDGVGDLALACQGGQWREEAEKFNSWVQESWEIMDKIKLLVIRFDSVDDALLALPKL